MPNMTRSRRQAGEQPMEPAGEASSRRHEIGEPSRDHPNIEAADALRYLVENADKVEHLIKLIKGDNKEAQAVREFNEKAGSSKGTGPSRRDSPVNCEIHGQKFVHHSTIAKRAMAQRLDANPATQVTTQAQEKVRRILGFGGAYVGSQSPFTADIESYPLPAKFKAPAFETYTGDSDPRDHLARFHHSMKFYGAPDPLICRAFPMTLKGKARMWFENLQPGSIASFVQLAELFYTRFQQRKKFQKTSADLMNIRQKEDETLRSYIDRFNDESLQVDTRSEEVVINAFLNGLRPGIFYKKLATTPPATVQALMERAEKFAQGKEADRKKKELLDKKE